MEKTPLPESEYWIMHFDGSKMKKGSGAGVVLKSPKGDTLSYVLQIHFNATNNIALIIQQVVLLFVHINPIVQIVL